MKTIFKLSLALTMSLFLWAAAAGQSLNDLPKSWNFAVEINGVLCGFSKSEITTIERDGKKLLSLNEEVLVKQSALGGKVDLLITNNALIEPANQLPVFVEQRFMKRLIQ